jgi:hypothetical protein
MDPAPLSGFPFKSRLGAVTFEQTIEATAGYADHAPIYNNAFIAVAIP